jgi:hypothetical protein
MHASSTDVQLSRCGVLTKGGGERKNEGQVGCMLLASALTIINKGSIGVSQWHRWHGGLPQFCGRDGRVLHTLSLSALRVYLEYSMKWEVPKLILISQRTNFYYQSLIQNQILTSIIMTRREVMTSGHQIFRVGSERT